MWRKNRNPNVNCTCSNEIVDGYNGIGVDLNRNFDFNWGVDANQEHASDQPCDEMYHGPHPFSEAETINIKNYLEGLDQELVLGLSLHSHAQMWLWPYGYDHNVRPENYKEIVSLCTIHFFLLYVSGLWNIHGFMLSYSIHFQKLI